MEEYWTFETVQERLVEALGFLDRVTPSGHDPYAKDGPWRLIRPEWGDYIDRDARREMLARDRGGLRAHEVDRMMETLGWIEMIRPKPGLRKLVGVVLLQLLNGGSQPRWADVRATLRTNQSAEVLRKTYSAAITRIAERLNAKLFNGYTTSTPTLSA
ncbi:hypothetical protein [Sphingomonas sp. YL-JM2C]